MSEEINPVLILGLGGAGGKVVSRIAAQGISALSTVVIDTDADDLAALDAHVTAVTAGADWTWRSGSGCGGDVIRGEQAVARERHRITELVEGRKLAVIVAGLGGGVATGGLRTLASVIRSKKIPALFLVTTPFSFESFARRKASDECIEQLLPVTDILIRVPNDLLFSMLAADSTVEEAFAKSCDELARTALGLCGILNCQSSFSTDYAGFMAALHGRKCQCGLGVGIGVPTEASPDRSAEALERMLRSPFLGGASKIAGADAVIASVCAGPDLQLGEMKRTLEAVANLAGHDANLMTGFSTAAFMGNAFQLALVTIKYDVDLHDPAEPVSEEPVPAKPGKSRRKKDSPPLEQGVLALQSFSRGIFSSTIPVMYGDEDIDIPTFQRRGIVIDKGTSAR